MATEIKQAADMSTLVLLEHEEARKGYELGRMWLLGKGWEGSTPGTNYLIENLKIMARHKLFDGEHDEWLNWHIGFVLGMLSSRIPAQSGE